MFKENEEYIFYMGDTEYFFGGVVEEDNMMIKLTFAVRIIYSGVPFSINKGEHLFRADFIGKMILKKANIQQVFLPSEQFALATGKCINKTLEKDDEYDEK